jgi:hypothetical protein
LFLSLMVPAQKFIMATFIQPIFIEYFVPNGGFYVDDTLDSRPISLDAIILSALFVYVQVIRRCLSAYLSCFLCGNC